MAELLKNPGIMVRAQSELRETIAKDQQIDESIIESLHYLQAIVKETLRLHPPVPFLIPHRADTDVEMCGFMVPKNTHVVLNVWTIGRDPGTWEDPDIFQPERCVGILSLFHLGQGGGYVLDCHWRIGWCL
ncbi:unspecific monooxygenase [Ranunculus cassubicifolius]